MEEKEGDRKVRCSAKCMSWLIRQEVVSGKLDALRVERLAAARKWARLRQADLAVSLGDRYDQTMISHVES